MCCLFLLMTFVGDYARVVGAVAFCLCFFNDTATTEIYTDAHTLSLHDALPISSRSKAGRAALDTGAADALCWAMVWGSCCCPFTRNSKCRCGPEIGRAHV